MEVHENVFHGFNKVWVLKRGNIYSVYMDENGRPVYLPDAENIPTDYIPITRTDLGEIQYMFPGAEVQIVEKKRPKPPVAKPSAKTDEIYNKMLKGIPEKDREQLKEMKPDVEQSYANPLVPTNIPPATAVTLPSIEEANASPERFISAPLELLSYIEKKMSQYEVASGKKKTELKRTVEALAQMTMELWPDSTDALLDMKDNLSKPKFELE